MLGQEPLSQHTGSRFYTSSWLSPHFMKRIPGKTGNRYLHKNVCSYYGLQRLLKVNGFKSFEMISLGNVNVILEKIFKPYNRLLVISAIK